MLGCALLLVLLMSSTPVAFAMGVAGLVGSPWSSRRRPRSA